MAEEFALHEFGRDGDAVDGDEFAGGLSALLVELAGEEFLAHAGFAEEQAVGWCGRDLFDEVEHGFEALGGTDNGVKFLFPMGAVFPVLSVAGEV